MPEKSRRDALIKKHMTSPDKRPLEKVDIMDVVLGGAPKSSGKPPGFGPNGPGAKSKKRGER